MRSATQDACDGLFRDAVDRGSTADFARKDEAEFSIASFFVAMHGAEKFDGFYERPGGLRADAANERDDAGDGVGGHACHFMAKQRRAHHAPGDGFAVLKASVAG